ALEDVNDCPLVAVVGIVVLRVGLADERVGTDVDFVAETHFLFGVAIEGRTEDSDDDDGYAEVDDVSAIASSVAMIEVQHRAGQAEAGMALDDLSTAHEFRDDGEGQ